MVVDFKHGGTLRSGTNDAENLVALMRGKANP